MKKYYLAIDIGASSGRHILGHMNQEKLVLQEIHRFENSMTVKNNQLCWDYQHLFDEIIIGMKKCKEMGTIPISVGIDTWGVDFVLLDHKEQVLGSTVAYRDSRTEGMDKKVYEIISEEALYERTGIQKQPFNTIYQLMAVKEQYPQYLKEAKHFLMVPDYLHYLLTGVISNEYTNATTTQLVNPVTKEWDLDLIEALGYNQDMFSNVLMPGTELGGLQDHIQQAVGYNCTVVLPGTHDTASAVVAVPAEGENALYISSGTWSLLGVELNKPNCSKESAEHNFTNEGGCNHTIRYLKNIMGLWMIQSAKKEVAPQMSYGELCAAASLSDIKSIVDCNNPRFIAPDSMVEEIMNVCKETHQQVPKSPDEIASVIYRSLSDCYAVSIKELEAIIGTSYDTLYVVGGGADASYLNQLTANYTNLKVMAGPTEATAIGNLIIQMIKDKVFSSIKEARACIRNSFDMAIYSEERITI